ncbi:MAG TPA: XRE family transcriptional regulator [Burkholderiaceae bacterium]|nr:XRE family transcriptional regulator [Burkholderiaceae bacterium]
MHYTPPTPEQLRALKQRLGFIGEQMAQLFGLAGNNQWRKYTGGAAPREMNLQMLFFAAARLALDDEMNAHAADWRQRRVGNRHHTGPSND